MKKLEQIIKEIVDIQSDSYDMILHNRILIAMLSIGFLILALRR